MNDFFCEGQPCVHCGGKTFGKFKSVCPAKRPDLVKMSKIAAPAESYGLGDFIESRLTKIGITQEKWVAWKGEYGLPACCNCEARKKWLNKFGEQFGRVPKVTMRLVLRWWAKGIKPPD